MERDEAKKIVMELRDEMATWLTVEQGARLLRELELHPDPAEAKIAIESGLINKTIRWDDLPGMIRAVRSSRGKAAPPDNERLRDDLARREQLIAGIRR